MPCRSSGVDQVLHPGRAPERAVWPRARQHVGLDLLRLLCGLVRHDGAKQVERWVQPVDAVLDRLDGLQLLHRYAPRQDCRVHRQIWLPAAIVSASSRSCWCPDSRTA
jgi:hypothetical protein